MLSRYPPSLQSDGHLWDEAYGLERDCEAEIESASRAKSRARQTRYGACGGVGQAASSFALASERHSSANGNGADALIDGLASDTLLGGAGNGFFFATLAQLRGGSGGDVDHFEGARASIRWCCWSAGRHVRREAQGRFDLRCGKALHHRQHGFDDVTLPGGEVGARLHEANLFGFVWLLAVRPRFSPHSRRRLGIAGGSAAAPSATLRPFGDVALKRSDFSDRQNSLLNTRGI